MSYPICKHDHSAHNFPCPSCEQDERISQLERELAASQKKARRLREALDAIMASAKVAYCATTDPMMTDALVGIGKRCADAMDAELAKEGSHE